MDYLLFNLWPYVLLALILGGMVGYYTCPSAEPDED